MSDNNSVNIRRRKILLAGVSMSIFWLASCTSVPKKREPIIVDVSEVNDIPSLILAIKRASGNSFPKSTKDENFYSEFADIFVKNARAAVAHGYAIPQWVLDKLPQKQKVVLPILTVVLIVYLGIEFAIPLATIILAVLASITLMFAAIFTALKVLSSSNEQSLQTAYI